MGWTQDSFLEAVALRKILQLLCMSGSRCPCLLVLRGRRGRGKPGSLLFRGTRGAESDSLPFHHPLLLPHLSPLPLVLGAQMPVPPGTSLVLGARMPVPPGTSPAVLSLSLEQWPPQLSAISATLPSRQAVWGSQGHVVIIGAAEIYAALMLFPVLIKCATM